MKRNISESFEESRTKSSKESVAIHDIPHDLRCPICHDGIAVATSAVPCLHTFCYPCLSKWHEETNNFKCPVCCLPIEKVLRNRTIDSLVEKYFTSHDNQKRFTENLQYFDSQNGLLCDSSFVDAKGRKDNLFKAVMDNKTGVLRKLLNVDENDENGVTPLMIASALGNDINTRLLLDHGASIDIQDDIGTTALIGACLSGAHDTVKVLCEKGALVNATNNILKSTPLMIASSLNYIQCIQILYNYGADINLGNDLNTTALMTACLLGHVDTVQLLCQLGALTNIQDIYGYTALMFACQCNYENIVQILLQYQANPYINEISGINAFHVTNNNAIKNHLRQYKKINENTTTTSNNTRTTTNITTTNSNMTMISTADIHVVSDMMSSESSSVLVQSSNMTNMTNNSSSGSS